jgi:NitT/TauT family transport system substrate-binding protein
MVRLPFCFVVLGFALAATGCGRKSTPVTGTEQPAEPSLRKVVLQTDWFPQGEHGGFYQALARGFYREAGLDVDIAPGGPGSGIKLKVARGDADFGMNRSDDIIMAASQGLPLVIVAATMQHDPQGIMVHAESPVNSLRDLQGRTVMANVHMTWIPYLQKKYGITFNLVPNTYNIGAFLADPQAIQQCLVTNEPFFAQEHGTPVRTIALASSGYDCYQVLFCRRELIRDAPGVVRAFVAASIRGWRDYLDGDPTPADTLIQERNTQMTAGQLKFSRGELKARSLVRGDPARGEDVGLIALPRLQAEMQTLVELKVLEAPVSIPTIATTRFLPQPPAR